MTKLSRPILSTLIVLQAVMSLFAAVDYAKLAPLMRLPEQQFVTFAQTVGYPYG